MVGQREEGEIHWEAGSKFVSEPGFLMAILEELDKREDGSSDIRQELFLKMWNWFHTVIISCPKPPYSFSANAFSSCSSLRNGVRSGW